ncbi:MAG TPA: precorrin-4 C(11)-methyltransferase [Polyangiaceae bacterium]|nr:precorrin-4 C(11)-methyltransferase [Polyangiaceae bacterium]
MRVYIIGAGPGDPGLITVRGAELIARCPVVFYTGSLVPKEIVARANAEAKVLDSSSMTLDQIVAVLVDARDRDLDVARVHTGDPTIFGSTAEQMRRMVELGIEYEIVPGVSSFTAAAAALGRELTLPELSQTVILTRAEGRTPMPAREKLEELAAHRATLCLFLSITLLRDVVAALSPAYGADCPVAIVHRASWPDQVIVRGTLADIRERARAAGLKSQSMIVVGRVLTATDFANSKLYDPEFTHRFRRAVKPGREPEAGAGARDVGRPLVGKTIVVARARPGRSQLAQRLQELGATTLELPHVEKGVATHLELGLSDTSERDVALLTSIEAAEAWLESGSKMPVVALGNEVTAALRAANQPPVFTLRGACVDALEEARSHLEGCRVFLPIAAGSPTTLSEPLSALGATPVIVPIAAYQISMPIRWPERIDLIVLPSSLAALALYSQAPPSISNVSAVAIGPRSAAQAESSGAIDVRTAGADTIEALVATVVESLAGAPRSLVDARLGADVGVAG